MKIRAAFMTNEHKDKMGKLPRTHRNCYEATGVCRPGKTAADKANGAWASHAMRRERKVALQASFSKDMKKRK